MSVAKRSEPAIQEEIGDDLRGLVRRAGEGERHAFQELFERYHDRVYRYAYARLGDPEEARDALQDVFLAVWGGLPGFQYEHEGSFPAWLFGIARNVLGSRRRKRSQSMPLVEDVLADADVEFEGTALSRRMLVDELAKLPTAQREVLVLRFLVGLPCREVAAALGRSEGAVTALQLRGLRRLCRQIGDFR